MIKVKFRPLMILVFLIGIGVIMTPFLVRSFNGHPLFSGEDFYLSLRAVQDLSHGIYWDYLENRLHQVSLSHYILSLLFLLGGTELVALSSVIIGILSLFFFFLIIRKFFDEKNVLLLSSLLLILSPIFIYLFTRANSLSFAVLFSLIFIFFLLRNSYWSAPFLVLASLTNFSVFLADIILLVCYFFYSKKKTLFWSNLIPSVIAAFLFGLFNRGFIIIENIFSPASFTSFFTSFGANAGVAFFYLFLGLLGFFTVWRRKKVYNYFLISFVLLFIFGLFNVAGRIMLNFYLCVLSGLIIWFLIKREWAIITIKKFTLLLIFCGIIFSTSLYIDQLIKAEPRTDLVDGLLVLKNHEEGIVFSHESYGYLIEYFGGKQAFLDSSSFYYEGYSLLKDAEQGIFYLRHLDDTELLLKENNIRYVIITPEMKKGLVWKRESEGLLFLIENTDVFEELYSENNIFVLEYKGWT